MSVFSKVTGLDRSRKLESFRMDIPQKANKSVNLFLRDNLVDDWVQKHFRELWEIKEKLYQVVILDCLWKYHKQDRETEYF